MPRRAKIAGCPHENVVHCPLYHASHGHDLDPAMGCIYGDWAEGCAVERRELSYRRAIKRMSCSMVGLAVVLGLSRQEREDEAKAQRERNMRLAGIR